MITTAVPDGNAFGIRGASNLLLAGLLARDIGCDPKERLRSHLFDRTRSACCRSRELARKANPSSSQ
jgi:hypothetical protein